MTQDEIILEPVETKNANKHCIIVVIFLFCKTPQNTEMHF